MKKKLTSLILFVLLLPILSGCLPYGWEYPYVYTNTKWISTDPDIWFVVDENTGVYPKGQLKVDGRVIDFHLGFGYTNYADFAEWENDSWKRLFRGECKYAPDKLVVTIIKEDDYVFGGEYDEIIFIKYPLEEEALPDPS